MWVTFAQTAEYSLVLTKYVLPGEPPVDLPVNVATDDVEYDFFSSGYENLETTFIGTIRCVSMKRLTKRIWNTKQTTFGLYPELVCLGGYPPVTTKFEVAFHLDHNSREGKAL
ncbi:hypothetical protein HPB50_020231 [Hyalomma asiaticum]|uniref:Uncharacterized protein n=1 Tax=Hyalomma asiaticum TaxID=266040 RepID=A0ACB7T3X3_HYAAI|nr:hypothetical protein HPB50_020231 [Hyalomma asiaticum]